MKNTLLFFVVLLPGILFGQDFKWDRTIDFFVSPGISTSLLGSVSPDEKAGYSASQLMDSFSKSDVSNNFINFGIAVNIRKTDRKFFSVGLSYLTTGFTRKKEGNMFGYVPHPEMSVYSNLSEGPTQILNYDFTYSYLALNLNYLGRIDGAGLMLKNTKWWYSIGIAPALLLSHKMTLRTQGFTLMEGNNIDKYDYVVNYTSNGEYLNAAGNYNIVKVTPPSANVFVTLGTRIDYTLSETMHLLVQPKLNLPLLPSASGVQTAWCPQAAVDLGIIWPLH